MNYKKVISNKQIRLKILELLDFVPDELMIKLQYKIATGRSVNLDNVKRYSEKLQWYKLNYRNPLMTKAADKYKVRDYIKSKGYKNLLVPLYGVYDSPEDINFDKLPNKFVLKTNNGSHTNILCNNKNKLDKNKTKKKLKNWLKRSPKYSREWAYYNIEPKIICEKYLEKDENNDLVDYKIFCFNGEPFCLYVIIERFLDDGIKLGIYDTDFKKMPYRRADIAPIKKEIKKPENFDEMVMLAKKLSADFPHARVDFYNIDGKIYFGELTFYDGSGYKGFIPDEFDYILGDKFDLPEKLNPAY